MDAYYLGRKEDSLFNKFEGWDIWENNVESNIKL